MIEEPNRTKHKEPRNFFSIRKKVSTKSESIPLSNHSTDSYQNSTKPNQNSTKPNQSSSKPNQNSTKPNQSSTKPNQSPSNNQQTLTKPNQTSDQPNQTSTKISPTACKNSNKNKSSSDEGTEDGGEEEGEEDIETILNPAAVDQDSTILIPNRDDVSEEDKKKTLLVSASLPIFSESPKTPRKPSYNTSLSTEEARKRLKSWRKTTIHRRKSQLL